MAVDAARCREELASLVLDANEPVTYRTLTAITGASLSVVDEALAAFAADKADQVGALALSVQKDAKHADPRARVISIQNWSQGREDKVICSQIYGVFACANENAEQDPVTTMGAAFWSHERKCRNDEFDRLGKKSALSKALRAFYASDVLCQEATTRAGAGESQGEEAVSVFDSMKSTKKPQTSSSFGSAAKTAAKSSSKPFFNSSSSTTTKSRVAAKTAAAAPPSTKKIDSSAMDNVLTIDSDDDSDDDQPVFVKKTPATAKTGKKRVISDDEDEEEEPYVSADEQSKTPKPHATQPVQSSKTADSSTSRSVKRKLNDTGAKSADEAPQVQRKKNHVVEDNNDEEDEEAADQPVETKRRVMVTKTRINELGYMVTEQTYEEVELTKEELEEEKRKQAAKKKATRAVSSQNTSDTSKTKAKSAKGASGPPKQKNLFDFFGRK